MLEKDQSIQLYLASSSPRRQTLLQQAAYLFSTLVIDIDETPRENEKAEAFVTRMAIEKARAGWAQSERQLSVPVLAADTVVVVEGSIVGKPRDREHAIAILESLSGRCHHVLSAVALKQGEQQAHYLSSSEVCFRHLSRAEIESYWQTGEPAGKAGAYAIQGRAALFIRKLTGSYSSVMGLPLYETGELLAKFGVLPTIGIESSQSEK